MMNFVKELLNMSVDWQKTKESPYVFSARIAGRLVRLRLNDFPEEPLCTVLWEGRDQDLEDLGKAWTLPKHRGE